MLIYTIETDLDIGISKGYSNKGVLLKALKDDVDWKALGMTQVEAEVKKLLKIVPFQI